MTRTLKNLTAFFLLAATVCGACVLPTAADAAETVYDSKFDTVCKVGEANKCYSAQGMAVGDEYLYFCQIGDNDARAVVHRIHIESGDRELMSHSETGKTYFENFSHANDLDWMVVDGEEYLCVLATPKLLVFKIDDTELIPHAEYNLKYNGSTFSPGGMAVEEVSGNRVTYLFKWGRTISYARMPIKNTTSNISVVIRCTLDVSKVEVDGKKQDFTDFVNQGMGYSDGFVFMPITGNHQDETINHSLILAYDISEAKNNVTLQPDASRSFYVISEDYPALFEIEDCGVSDDGRLYFNTNSRRTNNDTKHDAAFVLNDFVVKATPTYTVVYNGNGGTGTMKSVTVKTTEPLDPAKNTFKREGYTFTGWVATSALTGKEVKIGDAVADGDTVTLTAQWKKDGPTTYTVVYNGNGGTGSMASATVDEGTPLTAANNAFKREGYTFTGWGATSALSGKGVKLGDTIAAGDTITLTAQWKKNAPTIYTVVYNGNGGVGEMASVTVSAKDVLKAADNSFVKEGYTFTGWVATSALTGKEVKLGDTVAAGDTITLTAQWEKNAPTTYTVIYNGNGATGEMASQTVAVDTPLAAANNAFKRDGYTFTGWVATSALTGKGVKLGDTVAVGDTVTLTAVWAMNGDMNGDGKLTIADAFAIRLYDWGYYPLPADRASLMDVNEDGVVNASDAHHIFAHIAGAVDVPTLK